MPVTMRLAPTCVAILVIAVMKATGNPSLSISLAITAPLRVQEPQVDTSSTASTPSAFMSVAILLPMASMSVIVPSTPVVP